MVKKIEFGRGCRIAERVGVKVLGVQILPIGSWVSCRLKAWLKSCYPMRPRNR